MKKFELKANYKATVDQQKAIEELAEGIEKGKQYQVLLGVTGSGKTFTAANVIEKLQRPTLIISHNKTLAAQLYQEFRDFFPENAVSYFVSYYDYYQPEAYIPSTDTYIEKDSDINELIDKLRLAATTNILTRRDTIIIASVSCIYNIGSPKEYGSFIFELGRGMKVDRRQIMDRLIDLQYARADYGFHRGTFRAMGDRIDVYPAYLDIAVNLELEGGKIINISTSDPVSGEKIEGTHENYVIYPAKHFVTDPTKNKKVFEEIGKDLMERVAELKKEGKELEAHRLKQKVTYDLEMIAELGYVKGIENYSRYFDGRKSGDAPFSLLDYFNDPYGKQWLVFVDESHITFPQIRGMYNGDLSRKKTLIDYGFRLPAALDNRPLTFEEFMRRIPNFIATSATPSDWEVSMAKQSANGLRTTDYGKTKRSIDSSQYAVDGVVQQLLRPTGIVDPKVEIRPVEKQVADVAEEIKRRVEKGERTLVTTLTKRTAEDLSEFLAQKGLKVHYLHSDVDTLERSDILDDLRRGNYDCLVGINLLREGLDLPEVSLVAILDADKEGFLRSDVTLVQTMGRAARHMNGEVIMYADKITGSMKRALEEVERRRKYQLKMNKKLGIVPSSISKPIRERLVEADKEAFDPLGKADSTYYKLPEIDVEALTPMDKKKLVRKLKREMRLAADDLNFELAIEIRDKVRELETE